MTWKAHARLGELLGPGKRGNPHEELISKDLEIKNHNARTFARGFFRALAAEAVAAEAVST